jgi:methyltransferase
MELSQTGFLALVAVAAAARLGELARSRTNQRRLLAKGASLAADPNYRWMVLLHSGWLAGMGLEVILAERPFLPWLGFPALFFFLAANGLRYWAIRSLSHHWNTQVVNSTGLGIIATGPYRWIRHPNYTAVFVELAALPLVHTAFMTAALATILHIPVLAQRIRSEEEVLMSSEEYRRVMGNKPRFLP